MVRAAKAGVNIRLVDSDHVSMSADEKNESRCGKPVECFAAGDESAEFDDLKNVLSAIPQVRRTGPCLTHSVFHRCHSRSECYAICGVCRQKILRSTGP